MTHKCFVIAEAGVNHNGNLEFAHKLVDVAAKAGADAIKFQIFRADRLVTSSAPKVGYQETATGAGSQQEMLARLEIADQDFVELHRHAQEKEILFACTAFDLESLEFLDRLGIPFIKIPSGEVNNYQYLKAAASFHRPIVLSTGMSSLAEVRQAVDWLGIGPDSSDILPPLTVLHCTTAYPAPLEEINLKAITTLARELALPIGYSDHSEGIDITIAAVALGSTVVEKHFTLDRGMEGPDHAASLEPDQLAAMITGIRRVEKALGDGTKQPTPSEREARKVIRRYIVARNGISVGEVFTPENVTSKRSANGGLPASEWPNVMGQAAKRAFEPDDPIEI